MITGKLLRKFNINHYKDKILCPSKYYKFYIIRINLKEKEKKKYPHN